MAYVTLPTRNITPICIPQPQKLHNVVLLRVNYVDQMGMTRTIY